MGFGDGKMIGGPMSGPPPQHVVCEPVPMPKAGAIPCRRGQGSRTFQGEKPPTCDGLVKPKTVGNQPMLACEKCGLTHAMILCYGAVL